VDGLGGSLNTWAFLTVRRTLSISSSCGMQLPLLMFAELVVEGTEWKREGAGFEGCFACAWVMVVVVRVGLERAVALRSIIIIFLACNFKLCEEKQG